MSPYRPAPFAEEVQNLGVRSRRAAPGLAGYARVDRVREALIQRLGGEGYAVGSLVEQEAVQECGHAGDLTGAAGRVDGQA